MLFPFDRCGGVGRDADGRLVLPFGTQAVLFVKSMPCEGAVESSVAELGLCIAAVKGCAMMADGLGKGQAQAQDPKGVHYNKQ